MAVISATGLQSLVTAAGTGSSFSSTAVQVCKIPGLTQPIPIPYSNVSGTAASAPSSAAPAGQKGMVTRECWAAALEGAVARAYRAPLFDLDSEMRSLSMILEEIRRNRAALDAMQIESRHLTVISNARKAHNDVTRNSMTNVR